MMEEARQCSRSAFLFSDIQPWRLCYPQDKSKKWRVVGYVIYKWIFFLYFLAFILYGGIAEQEWYDAEHQRVKWFIYLTNWTFFVFVIQLLFNAICTSLTLSHPDKPREWVEVMVNSQPRWYLKLNWILYEIACPANFLVAILYWAIVYTPGVSIIDPDTWNSHGSNAVFCVLIDMWITAMPVRILHIWLPALFGLMWNVFAVIYDLVGGTNALSRDYIYSVLNWSEDPATAGIYLVVAICGIIVCFCIIFGLYYLRMTLYKKCCGTEDAKVDSEITMQRVA